MFYAEVCSQALGTLDFPALSLSHQPAAFDATGPDALVLHQALGVALC